MFSIDFKMPDNTKDHASALEMGRPNTEMSSTGPNRHTSTFVARIQLKTDICGLELYLIPSRLLTNSSEGLQLQPFKNCNCNIDTYGSRNLSKKKHMDHGHRCIRLFIFFIMFLLCFFLVHCIVCGSIHLIHLPTTTIKI